MQAEPAELADGLGWSGKQEDSGVFGLSRWMKTECYHREEADEGKSRLAGGAGNGKLRLGHVE